MNNYQNNNDDINDDQNNLEKNTQKFNVNIYNPSPTKSITSINSEALIENFSHSNLYNLKREAKEKNLEFTNNYTYYQQENDNLSGEEEDNSKNLSSNIISENLNNY